jgi:hypothetical protein
MTAKDYCCLLGLLLLGAGTWLAAGFAVACIVVGAIVFLAALVGYWHAP